MKLAALLLAALFLLAAPAEAETAPRIPQMVGQLLFVRMHGTEPTQAFLDRIKHGEIGGVVLYNGNFPNGNPAPLIRLLQSAATVGHQPKLLVAIDQEGGEVKRLRGAPTLAPPQMTTPTIAQAQGLATARNLRAHGLNVDFAPVLDVNHGGFVGPRTFHTAREANAFAHGLALGGVIATAKHFPGLGYAKLNTDDAVATVKVSAAKLRADWKPYVGTQIPLVMLSTAVYPTLGTHIPAAMSRVVVARLRRLGYDGAIVTDALQTPAVNSYYSTPDAALRAVQVGVDLVLAGGTSGSTRDSDVATAVYDELVAAAKSGRLSARTLRDAYQRVLALKAQLPR